ncbi:hypothetical protein MMC30_008449 [Trapelia coarctata]|nr:hypothetical protein [Trapelia coarctata]
MRPPKVKPGEYVVIVDGLPLPPTRDAWQPVKDLLRKIMVKKPDEIHTEPGAVNMSPTKYGRCACTIKDERAARKVCKWLHGNKWYGHNLSVALFHCKPGSTETIQLGHSSGAFEEPQELETISPIKDANLPQQAPLVPATSPSMSRTSTTDQSPGLPRSYTFSSGSSISMSNPAYTFHSRSSSVSTTSMYESANNVIGYMPAHVMHSPTRASGQGNHPNLALAQQNLEQCAYQPFRNQRPGQIGSQSMDNSLALRTAPPTVTTASLGGFTAATTPRYPATYSLPTASSGTPLNYSYHANPDGTLVNTTQGVIPVNESRAVLIRNINHRASPEDVRVHFSSAGIIEHCDISATRTEKKKCTATLNFRSPDEAKAAVRRFNGTKFMGRPISVEVAKDDSAIRCSRAPTDVAGPRTSETAAARTASRPTEGQGPLIVNGSDEDDPLYEPASSSAQKSKGKGKEKGMAMSVLKRPLDCQTTDCCTAEDNMDITGRMEKVKLSR